MKYIGKLVAAAIIGVPLLAFAPATAAQEIDLHDFVIDSVDGYQPVSGLTIDGKGNLFGTTLYGGTLSIGGTVFELSPTSEGGWTEKVIHNFNGSGDGLDGYRPYAGLISDGKGNLYGTTSSGGTRFTAGGSPIPYGTVFELSPADDGSWTETILYSFGASATDGATPMGSLVFDAQGNLYGTTYQGGATGRYGAVFELTPVAEGSWNEKIIYSFGATSTDGIEPLAGLVIDSAGNLYGTTALGGLYSNESTSGGTVFELTPAADGIWTETILHSFNTPQGDGSLPVANLVFDSKGNLYGTTESGGAQAAGTVFELSPVDGGAWSERVFNLYSSASSGYVPEAGLTIDSYGNLYGTTSSGGAYARTNVPGGTVFELRPQSDGTWTEEILHNFSGTATDGNTVYGGVIFDSNGNLYGTTEHGGLHAVGTVYELQSVVPTIALQYVAVTPCRIADTRNATGAFGGPELAGGSTRTFNIPQSACSIPSTAVAYSLNATVVPDATLGYLTVWPASETKPDVSTLNSDGRVKANATITPAGTDGGVSVYTSDPTQFILDIDGYFVPAGTSTSGLEFYPLTPCRIADTRNAIGPLGGPSLTGGVVRAFPVQNVCGIPPSAKAYSLNITAVPHGGLGYLTAWPAGETRPVVSTLNATTGAITANAAIVPEGTSGEISIYVSNDADVILDVDGYFAAPGTGGLSLYTVTPCRVIDTRNGAGVFKGVLTVPVETSVCAAPSDAKAYVLNATVVPSDGLGYLSLWAAGTTQPVVSTLNASDGAITSNMAIVPTNNGSVDAFASDPTQLILDLSGYFAP